MKRLLTRRVGSRRRGCAVGRAVIAVPVRFYQLQACIQTSARTRRCARRCKHSHQQVQQHQRDLTCIAASVHLFCVSRASCASCAQGEPPTDLPTASGLCWMWRCPAAVDYKHSPTDLPIPRLPRLTPPPPVPSHLPTANNKPGRPPVREAPLTPPALPGVCLPSYAPAPLPLAGTQSAARPARAWRTHRGAVGV